MPPSDMSPDEIEMYRRMTPTEKLMLVAELSHQETERQKAGIRARHADISDEELRIRLCMLRYGHEMTIKIFGWVPDD